MRVRAYRRCQPPLTAVLRCALPLSYQLFGHLGLPLQPGQSRRLVHASHLLAVHLPALRAALDQTIATDVTRTKEDAA
jgi:hypothetical protein